MRRLPLRSPPRVRGKVVAFFVYIQLGGITPAYAGKSFENLMGQNDKTGSPPRMRGKDPRVCKDLERVGITPAYAGKRCSPETQPMKKQDHPRVCGEK